MISGLAAFHLTFRYFVSYVSLDDKHWTTSVVRAARVEDLDVANRKPLFSTPIPDFQGFKDPWIFTHNQTFYLFLSVAVPVESTNPDSHSSFDIFNTGDCISASALAISTDLETWNFQGVVLKPDRFGWDRYYRRICSVFVANNLFYAIYDGSSSHHENYEERSAIAVSKDLLSWKSLSVDSPFWMSPYASRSLRYCSVLATGKDTIAIAYEFSRVDKSHELRLIETSIDELRLPSSGE